MSWSFFAPAIAPEGWPSQALDVGYSDKPNQGLPEVYRKYNVNVNDPPSRAPSRGSAVSRGSQRSRGGMRPLSGRPLSGRTMSGRPTSGRPTSGRPTSGRPTSGRPMSGKSLPPVPSRPSTTQSSPSLLGVPGGAMDWKPLWAPGGIQESMRAQTASPNESRQKMHRARKKMLYPGGGAMREKNLSVWQRWQVSVPSNRMQREEVLERDRKRQHDACGAENHRNHASPARSHAASLFFEKFPGDEVSEYLPPGAFRRVARPRTRQMTMMPNLATCSSTSSSEPAKGRPASRSGIAGRGERGDQASPVPRELANEDLLFEGKEGDRLTEALDDYASLTSGAEAAAVWMSCSSVDEPNLAQTLDSSSKSLMKTVTSRHGAKQEALNDPYILRPIFCRFLLASKLCGESESKHRYHDTIIEFDKHAVSLGAVVGMPRSHLLLLLAKILREKGGEDPKKDEIKYIFDPAIGDVVERKERPQYIKNFFSFNLEYALDHVGERKRMLDMKVAQISAIEENDVPECVLEEVTSGNVWPPLPPATVDNRQLRAWMAGVRQWQEELEEQVPARMLALRAHTETVLRGEVLSSQLLEPEVLHFSERFLPLFRHLFTVYVDWSTPHVLIEKVNADSDPPESQDREGSSQVDGDLHLGHMSFNAFFRLCVDFGIFPKHANFQEIRQVYNDAEATISIPQPTPPPTPSDEEPYEPPPMRPPSATNKEKKTRPTSAVKSDGSSSPSAAGKSKGFGGVRMDTRPPPRGSVHSDRVPPHLLRSKKALQAAAVAEAAAKAAAEAKVPKADLTFMTKTLSSMSDIELKTVAFFASIEEWLSERFVRFADLIGRSEFGEAVPLEVGSDVHTALSHFVKQHARSASKEDGDAHAKDVTSHAGDSSVNSRAVSKDVRSVSKSGSFVDLSGAAAAVAGNASANGQATGAATTAPPLADKSPPKEEEAPTYELPTLPRGTPALPDEVIQLQHALLANPLPANANPNARRNSGAERHARMCAAAAVAAAATAALSVPPVMTIGAERLLQVISTMGMANQPSVSEVEEMYRFLLNPASDEPLGMTVFQLDKVSRKASETMDQARRSCCALLRVTEEQTSQEQECSKLLEALDQQMLERTTLLGAPEDIFLECGDSGEISSELLAQLASRRSLTPRQASSPHAECDEEASDAPSLSLLEALTEMLSEFGTGTLNRAMVYRAVSLMQEGRRCQRQAELRTRLHCLAHLPQAGPKTLLFGLAAFVECLLKLALHRLGGKGSNEIQRGAPAWWKCAWLIALLSGQFQNHLRRYNHEQWVRDFEAQESQREVAASTSDVGSDEVINVTRREVPSPTRTPKPHGFPYAKRGGPRQKQTVISPRPGDEGDESPGVSPLSQMSVPLLASPSHFINPSRKVRGERDSPRRQVLSAEDRLAELRWAAVSPRSYRMREVDAWCERKRKDVLPRYVPPLEVLIRERPDLFDLDLSEANVLTADGSGVNSFWPVPCSQCKERRSPSGWGTPGCTMCGGVEEQCLPIKRHLFAALARTQERRAPDLTDLNIIPESGEFEPEADAGMLVENW